ncbi:MAG: Spy/CpxP family protein refolding chaperone [Desulfobacteraceae bacterium]|nr:Spy/CpxP family protein refolding chaperone [Desulfobacteraceae bacterium]
MKKRSTLVVWIFCALLAAMPGLWAITSSPVLAGDSGGNHHVKGGHGHPGMGMALKGLNLTEAQKKDIATILRTKRDEAKGIADEMVAARKNLFTLVGAADYNESAVRQAAHEISRLHEEMLVLRAGAVHQVQGLLTPEQKQKWDVKRARFADNMQDRMDDRFEHLDEWINAHSH